MRAGIRLPAVLFDLDGTLLAHDAQAFQQRYFSGLYGYLADRVAPQAFLPMMEASVSVMLGRVQPGRTMVEVFLAEFSRRTGLPEDELSRRFDAFYEETYPGLAGAAQPAPGARAAVEAARDAGCRLVVATLPVYPRDAIVWRIRWAGLGDIPFDLITSADVMSACKPHPEYFAEICRKLGVPPGECLMVGNDPVNDLAAADVGMSTFWYVGPGSDQRDPDPAALAAGRQPAGMGGWDAWSGFFEAWRRGVKHARD